ncbi:hypothetical protein [Bradyrhizobium japonicum]|uniref:hypothetical protein n=1 Tax=Bradyrhizobium japonicum TaxID=375 RepID=UPI001BA9551B|nr:hypothetical protein [Bradyrhizobium japonicum]MBR0956087.1 hypothetical protein [Bradyrhizobium japonicum]
MKSPICDMLGIEFPLLAFSHCRDVVAAVSPAQWRSHCRQRWPLLQRPSKGDGVPEI